MTNISDVIRLYVEECWSTVMIAKAFNTSPARISERLRAAGIPRRTLSEATKLSNKRSLRPAFIPEPCAMDGCEQPHYARGFCQKHYERDNRRGGPDVLLKEQHGHSGSAYGRSNTSRTYRSWYAMRRRCFHPKTANYASYGGRGITVCPEWADSFTAFLRDMGERPPGTSIDRIDSDGNYEPGNCRWATPLEQRLNRRKDARRR